MVNINIIERNGQKIAEILSESTIFNNEQDALDTMAKQTITVVIISWPMKKFYRTLSWT